MYTRYIELAQANLSLDVDWYQTITNRTAPKARSRGDEQVERDSAGELTGTHRPSHGVHRGHQPGTACRYASYSWPNCRRSVGSSYQCTNAATVKRNAPA